jgi:hypothetical protein
MGKDDDDDGLLSSFISTGTELELILAGRGGHAVRYQSTASSSSNGGPLLLCICVAHC